MTHDFFFASASMIPYSLSSVVSSKVMVLWLDLELAIFTQGPGAALIDKPISEKLIDQRIHNTVAIHPACPDSRLLRPRLTLC